MCILQCYPKLVQLVILDQLRMPGLVAIKGPCPKPKHCTRSHVTAVEQPLSHASYGWAYSCVKEAEHNS